MKYLVYITTICPVTETVEVEANSTIDAINLCKEGYCGDVINTYYSDAISFIDAEYVAVENGEGDNRNDEICRT